jgi:hypothetical protein
MVLAARWMIAVVLLTVGTVLLATAAYAAYIAKLWTAAAVLAQTQIIWSGDLRGGPPGEHSGCRDHWRWIDGDERCFSARPAAVRQGHPG